MINSKLKNHIQISLNVVFMLFSSYKDCDKNTLYFNVSSG